MEESNVEPKQDHSNHPLVAGYQEWFQSRCLTQTPTTVKAINAAYFEQDVELLEAYDRLLGDGSYRNKSGAWILHLVYTVRKNPALGEVSALTEHQLHRYAEMRKAINTVIYADGKKPLKEERNWEQENALKCLAVENPDQVDAITEIMVEQKTLDLECINGLLTERNNAHRALASGAL